MFGNSNGVISFKDWELGLDRLLEWKNEIFSRLLADAAEFGLTGATPFTMDELDAFIYVNC